MRRLALALLWLALAALPLALGLAGFGVLLARGVGLGVSLQLVRVLGQELLLPGLVLSWALWLLAARLLPALERSFAALALGLALAASLAFAALAAHGLEFWQPRGPRDVIATWALVAGGTALSLFLPRRTLRVLALGAIAGRARRVNVDAP